MVMTMTSPTPHEDALLALAFSLRANPSAYAVLVGAGVSAASGIPTAWGVMTDLIDRLAVLAGEDEPTDHEQWYKERYGEPLRYQSILEKIAPAPLERQRLLRAYFEPADPDSSAKQPTLAHRALARLVKAGIIRVLVTLNFDRLIEQAIRAEGMEPTIVASAADAEGLAPLHTLDCCVVHLHGDYLNPSTMLNTVNELASYEPAKLELLHRILADYGLIIAGWSGVHDPALVDAIKTQYPGRYTLSWVEPGTQEQPAAEFRTLKKGALVPTDADTAFGFLADSVAALNSRRARHPLTATVASETAKRELSGQWVAIGLHDRLSTEFEALHRLPEFPTADNPQEAPDGYAAMLDRIEEASKVPVALVCALAYWGDAKTDIWWTDEIERFSRQLRAGGWTKLLKLRLVAGSALYYAAGISAVASKRYSLLAQLLSHQRSNPFNDRQERLAEVLEADGALEGSPPRLYKFLRPLLSESLVAGSERLEDAWQTFEVLRMAVLVIKHPRFTELLSQLEADRIELSDAQSRFADAEESGGDIEHWRKILAAAAQSCDRTLGRMGELVVVHRPHILATDYVAGQRWKSPVAERLASELMAEGSDHLLIRDGVSDSALKLSAGLLVVSLAVGRRASELSWKGAVGGIGLDELWIDSALRA